MVSRSNVELDVAALLAAVEPAGAAPGRCDPLLAALGDARARRERAIAEVRILLAYARCFVYPHPYRLGQLSSACGLSVSGVRTAYGAKDVRTVAQATGMQPVISACEDTSR